jgi:hypothetical protein
MGEPAMSEESEEREPLHPVEGYFTDVASAAKKPPAWLIDGVLPQGLVFMAGPPKESFKSTITMALAALVAEFQCHALPKDWKVLEGGPVMIFSHEADAGELRVTLEDGLGVKLDATEAILVCNRPEDFRLDEEEGQEQLLHWMELRKPSLVIIDPLANFHSIEEKDAGQMIKIIAPLRRWAKDNGACVLIVHHTRKLTDDRQYKAADMRGTSALFGLCDGILMMSPAQGQYTVQIDGQFKRGKPWNKVVALGAWEMKGRQGGEQLREVDLSILKAIRHGYHTMKKLADHTHYGAVSLKKRVEFLTRNGHVKLGKVKGKTVMIATTKAA